MERDELERRTATFAAAGFTLASHLRDQTGGRRPADQLLDAATSVGANYRASGRARSRAEFIAKLGTVNEEADETVFWLEFCTNVGLGDSETVQRLLKEAIELRAIFAASCRTARINYRGRRKGRPESL